jgi:hypothetical protein
MMELIMSDNEQQSKNKNVRKPRKPYRKLHLEALGDLRSLTLGGSPGTGESGNTFIFKNRTPPTNTPGG